MIRFPDIYLLSRWSASSGRIRRRLFIKSEIYFGSDPKAEIKYGELGFIGRLNFLNTEFENFQTEEIKTIQENEIFFVGEDAFLWKRLRWRFSFALIFPVLAFLVLILMSARSGVNCDEWEFENGFDSNLRKSLASSNLMLAKAELNRLRELLSQRGASQNCVDKKLQTYEEEWEELYILEQIQRGKLKEASEVFTRFKDKYEKTTADILKSEIISALNQAHWKAWSMRRTRAREAYEMKKQIQSICIAIGQQADCYQKK